MFLGIDLGTGSVKAVLFDEQFMPVARESRRYSSQSPQPGWAEIDPERWWAATVEAVRGCVGGSSEKVEAIGFSGQSHSLLLTEADGTPVRPAILWYDQRAVEEVETVRKLDPQLLRALGNPLVPGMSLFSLLWLSRHEPQALRSARYLMGAKDWLRFRLTRVAATDPSDASATLLYDLDADHWHLPLLRALGLPERLLPPIVPSAARQGTLSAAAARVLGLPSGIPIATGAADAAATLVGLGVKEPGQVVLQVGTGVQIMAVSEAPSRDSDPRFNTFRDAGNLYYRMAAMLNGGTALEWAKAALGCDQEEMYRLGFECESVQGDVIFLPYVSGERTPHLNPQASGAWLGLRVGVERAELARAVFEGIAFAIKDGWAALRPHLRQAESLLLTGGGTTDLRWRQLLADILEMPLRVCQEQGSSARGAAMLAALASGADAQVADQPSLAEREELVRPVRRPDLLTRYQRFRTCYQQLFGRG